MSFKEAVVEKLTNRVADLEEKLQYMVDAWPSILEDGKFSFPDGSFVKGSEKRIMADLKGDHGKDPDRANILCIKCRHVTSQNAARNPKPEQFKEGCPNCGDRGMPGCMDCIYTIRLTEMEWKIVFMWASNWAAHVFEGPEEIKNPMPSIITEVRRQFPDITPLTIEEEVVDLQKRYPGAKIVRITGDGDLEEIAKTLGQKLQ